MSRLKPFRPLSGPPLIPVAALAVALSGWVTPLAGQGPPRVVTDHFTMETSIHWQGDSPTTSPVGWPPEGAGGPRLDGDLVRAWQDAQRSPEGSSEQTVTQTLRRSVARDDAGPMRVEYLTVEATAEVEGGREAVLPEQLTQGLLDGPHSVGPEELEAAGLGEAGTGEDGDSAAVEDPVRSFVALDAWRLAAGPPPGETETDLAEIAAWLRRRLPLELAALEVQPAAGESRSWTIRAELFLTRGAPETFQGMLRLTDDGRNLALEIERSDAWTAELERIGDLAVERHQRLLYRIETTGETGTLTTDSTAEETVTRP